MQTISINYALKFQLKFNHKYKVSKCGKVFNTQRGKMLKRCVNGGQVGYWIGREFYSLVQLRPLLEIIKPEFVPF